MSKYFLSIALFLYFLWGVSVGVFITDGEFSEKSRYLAWSYENHTDWDNDNKKFKSQRCLRYWYPEGRGKSGKLLFCLPATYQH